ncbi:trypsin delta-like isoform X2 [Lutzomyia longipalpis]|uniref:trypsin delta-like isoform X2 n=1 Tax=Lutzomyia longipalpis TaxID=7200 RepID=UPI00248463E1|nr:trypsin delta-like isoform X2 [Lutzomyia longipalpis]
MKAFALLLFSAILVSIQGYQNSLLHRRTILRPPLDKFIVGGQDAQVGQFPYMGALSMDGRGQFCGSSVISDTWLLTAGHCVEFLIPEILFVRLGSRYRNSGGQEHRMIRYVIHPDYDIATFMDYDVAVCEMVGPMAGPNIRPIPITPIEPRAPARTYVSGWGHTQHQGLPSDILQYVGVPVVDRDVCIDNYSENPANITDSMICAGEAGRDACQMDSGGPLTDLNNYLVGVVSWGNGCAWDGFPGVYANLAHPSIRDFIRMHTQI